MAGEVAGRDAVVIPTGYDPGSYSCVRSLGDRGVRTVVASEYDNVPAAASRFCDESVVIPSPHDDVVDYKDALLDLAARPAVRTVLPLRAQDPYVFARYYDEFDEHVDLVTPPLETLEQVHDRLDLYAAATAAGVPVPETRPLRDGTDRGCDVIVKSRYNVLTDRYLDTISPRSAETVKEFNHLRADEPVDASAIQNRMNHEPIAQEFVESDGEYLFGALYDRGDAVATFQHEQIRGDSYIGGGGVFRKSIYDPALEEVGETLLDSLDWHGLACIEYLRDADTGEYKLVEVNPRLWQSLPCAVRAGADFPYYYWLLATGRGTDVVDSYETGVGTHLLYGELGYLRSILRDESPFFERPSVLGETLAVLRSCVTSPYFDNLRVDDPRPFLRGFRHVVFG